MLWTTSANEITVCVEEIAPRLQNRCHVRKLRRQFGVERNGEFLSFTESPQTHLRRQQPEIFAPHRCSVHRRLAYPCIGSKPPCRVQCEPFRPCTGSAALYGPGHLPVALSSSRHILIAQYGYVELACSLSRIPPNRSAAAGPTVLCALLGGPIWAADRALPRRTARNAGCGCPACTPAALLGTAYPAVMGACLHSNDPWGWHPYTLRRVAAGAERAIDRLLTPLPAASIHMQRLFHRLWPSPFIVTLPPSLLFSVPRRFHFLRRAWDCDLQRVCVRAAAGWPLFAGCQNTRPPPRGVPLHGGDGSATSGRARAPLVAAASSGTRASWCSAAAEPIGAWYRRCYPFTGSI